MTETIVITAAELAEAIAQYDRAMRELYSLLRDTEKWSRFSAVCSAFERWSERGERISWQDAYIEAKQYIQANGFPPWEYD